MFIGSIFSLVCHINHIATVRHIRSSILQKLYVHCTYNNYLNIFNYFPAHKRKIFVCENKKFSLKNLLRKRQKQKKNVRRVNDGSYLHTIFIICVALDSSTTVPHRRRPRRTTTHIKCATHVNRCGDLRVKTIYPKSCAKNVYVCVRAIFTGTFPRIHGDYILCGDGGGHCCW